MGCEYQIIREKAPPVCTYTGELCTLCVLGNGKTHKEAEKAKECECPCDKVSFDGYCYTSDCKEREQK